VIGRDSLKWIFYVNLLVVVSLITYKIYLNFFEQDFESVHSVQVERIEAALREKERFRFAVVGNINNSVGIFERKIIPMLNAANIDFVVSAGNAVSNGGEDKYRAINRTLSHLDVPYVLTFGENEFSNFGSFRFYEHYGPYFFSFTAGNSRFIFLDSTGKTPFEWQLRWLEEQLKGSVVENNFVFLGHPLHQMHKETLLYDSDQYLGNQAFRQGLMALIEQYRIEAVFSANLSLYQRFDRNGTSYITTGGAGGLVLNNEESFYHFVTVTVERDQARIYLESLDIGQHQVLKTLESLWFFVHSLFYVGYHNFVLLLCILIVVAIKLHQVVFEERDYYPNFDLDPSPYLKSSLRVAMLTNNFLPFIGGVPLSIERLRQGLRMLGHKVLIVAPSYRIQKREEEGVLRAKSMFAIGEEKEFRLANVFQPRLRREVTRFKPDIVHVHHPFWLGSLGLWIARRRRVPAVYTYHTRLEHYAHFVPLPGLLFRNLISHYLIKRFANKCDGVIVPTYSAEEYLRVLGVRSNIFVQPTGIDFEQFQTVQPEKLAQLRRSLNIGNERVLISVSRLSTEKNIDFMIDAVEGLHEQSPVPFKFLIIGDGNDRARLQQRIDRLGLSEVVILAGSVPPEDIAAYYRLGDAFLFASKSETQGMVILEAMAAGLPVVAVRSSGIDDVVQEGVNGFKTIESQEKWRERTLQLLIDDELRKRLGDNALAFAKDFAIDNFARHVHRIYAMVLAAHEQRRASRSR
jgi:1,2-diacylglycerol 3-alpha-glucosyltransferase